MRKYWFILIAIFLPCFVPAQQCSCEEKFQFIKHELETNYVGYKDKVNPATRKVYEQLTKEYARKAKTLSNPLYCKALLREWIDFFKDGHIQLVNGKTVAYNDTTELTQRIRNTEIINIPEAKLKQLDNADTLEEGIYISLNDSTYTVAIVKNKNEFRDFVGVVISSRTNLWKPGQVKLEIQKPKNSKYYTAIVYNRYHVPSLHEFSYNGVSFDGGIWTKLGHTEKRAPPGKNDFTYKRVGIKKISDSTLYIQIGTFNLSNARAIDSVFKANETVLKSTPYLIIDLRENGGGGDEAYSPVLPYIYTGPVYLDGMQVYATHDNINRERQSLDNPYMKETTKNKIREEISLMEQNVGKFVTIGKDDTTEYGKIEPYPKRVVILTDHNCASTTEQFLLAAKQSKKVTIMGTRTCGELDYSNWLVAPSPCPDIEFHYSSTRSSRVAKGRGIDNIGIKPDIELANGKDWIEEAVNYLEK